MSEEIKVKELYIDRNNLIALSEDGEKYRIGVSTPSGYGTLLIRKIENLEDKEKRLEANRDALWEELKEFWNKTFPEEKKI